MPTHVEQILPEWAAKTVSDDQRRGMALLVAAENASTAGAVPLNEYKISDSSLQRAPDAARAHASHLALASARSLSRGRPFFKRITIRGREGERSICISDVRTTQSIVAQLESDFEVFGWTSAAAHLFTAAIGASVAGRCAHPFDGTVVARAHYRGRLLPTPSDATLQSGEATSQIACSIEARGTSTSPLSKEPAPHIGHAADPPVAAPSDNGSLRSDPRAQEPEQPTPRSLGTLNIAATADQLQWLSFHHDLRRSLLVEGPPGSGKTSVALMRIPCLIDRQWDDLGVETDRDAPFYSEERTVVVIPRATLKHALSRLAATVEVPNVRYSTADALAVEVLRISPFGAAELRDTFEAETNLMPHRQLSTLLRYFLGRRAFAVAAALTWSAAAQRCSRARVKDLESRVIKWAEPIQRGCRTRTFSSVGCEWFAAGRAQPAKLVYADRCLLDRTCRDIFGREGLIRSALEVTPDENFLAELDLTGAIPLLARWREKHPSDLTGTSQGELHSLAAIACDVWSRDARKVVPNFLRAVPFPTHIVIDEVQDFSDEALGFLQAFLADNGVITAAGDRLQAQRKSGSSKMWGGLAVSEFDHVSLEVNYRQSLEVGGFVSRAHKQLFNAEPSWAVGPRCSGTPVRICTSTASSVEQLARVVLTEVKTLQSWNPRCTIAVIHLGDAEFSVRLSQNLQRLGLRSHTLDSANAEWENQRLLVSTAESCKGLEFDATVVVDLSNSGRDDSYVQDSAKRELFVALSRACDRMAVVAGNRESGRLLRACAK